MTCLVSMPVLMSFKATRRWMSLCCLATKTSPIPLFYRILYPKRPLPGDIRL